MGVTVTREQSGLREDAAADSFESIYGSSWNAVFRYCLALTRSVDDAEDDVAETFHRAYRSWVSGARPAGAHLAWLFLIARRIVIDRARRRRLASLLRLRAAVPAMADDAICRSEVWLWFEQLCLALPDRQREVLVLRYHFDLPDDEIGRLMRLSPAGVRTLAARALVAIRRQPEVLD
jgi:RNA polymerase sigma factor (sigma-70 family)